MRTTHTARMYHVYASHTWCTTYTMYHTVVPPIGVIHMHHTYTPYMCRNLRMVYHAYVARTRNVHVYRTCVWHICIINVCHTCVAMYACCIIHVNHTYAPHMRRVVCMVLHSVASDVCLVRVHHACASYICIAHVLHSVRVAPNTRAIQLSHA